jgi:hypothetical protein
MKCITIALVVTLAIARLHAETPEPNTLTQLQQEDGWELLFDGMSLDGWRGYKMQTLPDSWEVRDGAIFCNGKRGAHLLTRKVYGDFELSMEWKISSGGNSGILIRATETTPYIASNALEVQVVDSPQGWKEAHGYGIGLSQQAGALYGFYPSRPEAQRETGQWNHVIIRMVDTRIRVTQNDVIIADADMASDDWKARLARSKFGNSKVFNRASAGHIALQNYHGLGVWYRNIMVRPARSEPTP